MMNVLLAALLLLFTSLVQDGEKAPGDVRDRELKTLSSAEAAELVTAFKASWRAASTPSEKSDALDRLVQGRSPEISKELKKALGDRDREVVFRVVALLGTQPDDVARDALLSLTKAGRRFEPRRGAEAIRSLGYIGYGDDFKSLYDLFYKHGSKEVRKAIIEAVGRQKDKRAVGILISVLDQPHPKDPHDPSNPPASWWQDKFVEWSFFKDDAIAALEAITGQRFYNSETATEWAESEGKKLGIKLTKTPTPWT